MAENGTEARAGDVVTIYLMAARKLWDHDVPDGWKETHWERFNYVECGIFEKPKNELTEEDRPWVESYGEPPADFVWPEKIGG